MATKKTKSLADQNFKANVKRQIADLYKKVDELKERPYPSHTHPALGWKIDDCIKRLDAAGVPTIPRDASSAHAPGRWLAEWTCDQDSSFPSPCWASHPQHPSPKTPDRRVARRFNTRAEAQDWIDERVRTVKQVGFWKVVEDTFGVAGTPPYVARDSDKWIAQEDLSRVVRALTTCLYLYPHYELRYRCNSGAVMEAIELLRPDVAQVIRDESAEAARDRFWDEDGAPREPNCSTCPSPSGECAVEPCDAQRAAKKSAERPSVFFATARVKLEAGLERVGRDLCVYVTAGEVGRAICDCKYGIGASQEKGAQAGSEQTGCPEVHTALAMIRAMTDEEYLAILGRAGGVLT